MNDDEKTRESKYVAAGGKGNPYRDRTHSSPTLSNSDRGSRSSMANPVLGALIVLMSTVVIALIVWMAWQPHGKSGAASSAKISASSSGDTGTARSATSSVTSASPTSGDTPSSAASNTPQSVVPASAVHECASSNTSSASMPAGVSSTSQSTSQLVTCGFSQDIADQVRAKISGDSTVGPFSVSARPESFRDPDRTPVTANCHHAGGVSDCALSPSKFGTHLYVKDSA